MSTQFVRQRLIIQNENSNIIPNKMMTTEKRNNSKLPLGKGGSGLGNRKALNDITNKPNVHHEASTKKKNSSKTEFNVAEEKFLHDHSKCIDAQQGISESVFWDIVLPGCGPMPSEVPVSESAKTDNSTTSCCCYPEPVELPISEFCDWLQFVPPPSDSPDPSPPCSPQAWKFEAVEFLLKPESDG